jgi:hypothetical protein
MGEDTYTTYSVGEYSLSVPHRYREKYKNYLTKHYESKKFRVDYYQDTAVFISWKNYVDGKLSKMKKEENKL